MSNNLNTDRSTPAPHEPLPGEIVKLTAYRLQLVAKTQRIALLEALTHGEAGVQELADLLELPHQNVSYHLTLLWQAGILSRRCEGTTNLYAMEDWSAWWVVDQVVRQVRAGQDEQGA